MSELAYHLSVAELRQLAAALRAGRVTMPLSVSALRRIVPAQQADAIMSRWSALLSAGLNTEQLATVIDALIEERRAQPREERLQVVTTGDPAPGVINRDTAAVVRGLFAQAQTRVLVVGYAVHQGQQVFQVLADRMREQAELRVRLCLDISRRPADTTAPAALLQRFQHQFRQQQWPANTPMPEIFYDPRSLALEGRERSALHAKCVVLDGRQVFMSSANFTAAAQQRNIELGMLADSPVLAARVEGYFEGLIASGRLQRLV